jgi:anti-sigma regulatory factor (Ser/Thr protein kinase)
MEPGGFEHTALIVDSDETLRERLVPVLHRHLAAGEPVLIVVGPDTEWVIRDALGRGADKLEWGDPGAFYQRLGFAFEGLRRYLQDQHETGRSVHVIAEPDVAADPDAPVDRVAAYLAYESACNEVYARYGSPVTCLWDTRRHPALVIEDARSLHGYELTEAGRLPNPTYISTAEYLQGRADVALPPPPATVHVDVQLTDLGDLEPARSAVLHWSIQQDFSAQASADAVTAVSEVATNALTHGAPPVRLRAWRHGDTLVVQVDDRGGRPIPPNAGYHHPDLARKGLGLWLARHLADVLTTHTSRNCTSVRLHFPHTMTHQVDDRRPV